MNIYLIGCEYAGKTTLAGEIMEWADQHMGGTRHFHDHFTIPSSEPDGVGSSQTDGENQAQSDEDGAQAHPGAGQLHLMASFRCRRNPSGMAFVTAAFPEGGSGAALSIYPPPPESSVSISKAAAISSRV